MGGVRGRNGAAPPLLARGIAKRREGASLVVPCLCRPTLAPCSRALYAAVAVAGCGCCPVVGAAVVVVAAFVGGGGGGGVVVVVVEEV